MKLNLFLSAVSIFAVLHLCKAGPLRLQKRAAFYIANETACVVDNIVYSNGDPIPTDDPCEACKCRPPGFACVLKDCKVKVGCRAVRHAGQCCPEYVCDTPDRNPFTGGNALPPVNLLPALNDESVLPGDLHLTTKTPEPYEAPTNPTEPPQHTENNENKGTLAPESESAGVSSESPTVKSESLVTEESKLNPETEEKVIEGEQPSNEDKKEDLPEESEDKAVESTDETKVLLNSETEIKKDDTTESTTVKDHPTQPTAEAVKEEEPHTTVVNEIEETEHEVEVTEKYPEVESTSTEIPESEQPVKNSASENGKSLKLTDDDESKDPQKEKEIQADKPENTENKHEETVTELPSESSSEAQTVDTKESSSTESKPESEENIAEESQTNPHATSFYSNNEKIKSESAETVTIVVHVKEKTKPSTETDYVTENTTPKPATSVTQENLLKSNELGSTEISKATSNADEAKSTGKNFEIFPTSTEIHEIEPTTNPPSTYHNSEEVQGRSGETDTTASVAEKNPLSEEKVSDSKSTEDSSVATTTQSVNNVSEASKEARANEEATEETKTDEPTVTPIKIETITDSAEPPKTEESTKESGNEETTEKTISEETKPEVREDESKSEEKVEATTVQNIKESTSTEKIEESTPVEKSTPPQIKDKPEKRAEAIESHETTEKTNTEKVEITETEESKYEKTTESQDQGTEAPSDKE